MTEMRTMSVVPLRCILTAMTVALVAVFFASPAAADAPPPTVVVDWNNAALDEIRKGPKLMGPPMAARALAIAHTCMYDAWAAYDKKAVGTVPNGIVRRPVNERTLVNKKKAISFAAHRCLMNLFADEALYPPAEAQAKVDAVELRLDTVLKRLGYRLRELDSTDTTTPAGVGNVAAQAVIDARANDGSNQYGTLGSGAAYSDSDTPPYVALNEPMKFCIPTDPLSLGCTTPNPIFNPFHWQPLIGPTGSLQKCIAPHWSNVMPFALTSASQYDHLKIAEPKFQKNLAQLVKASLEVLFYSETLNEERKLIVEYWADGPESELPPGHWGLFAQHVSTRDNHSIDQDVKMFFAMHNASFDAGIVAWHLKRQYDTVRPITAIRYLFKGKKILAFGGPGQPTKLIPGEHWMPYNPGSNLTPAFPGFISGHSTFSAASAAVLKAFTGSDHFGFSTTIPKCDPVEFGNPALCFGRVEAGIPSVETTISYSTFSEAAQAAADSRIFGGIHFSQDNATGLALGEMVGVQAWKKAKTYFNGTAGQ